MTKRKDPTMIKIWDELTLADKQKLCDRLNCNMGVLALMRCSKVWRPVGMDDVPRLSYIFWQAIREKPRSKRI